MPRGPRAHCRNSPASASAGMGRSCPVLRSSVQIPEAFVTLGIDQIPAVCGLKASKPPPRVTGTALPPEAGIFHIWSSARE